MILRILSKLERKMELDKKKTSFFIFMGVDKLLSLYMCEVIQHISILIILLIFFPNNNQYRNILYTLCALSSLAVRLYSTLNFRVFGQRVDQISIIPLKISHTIYLNFVIIFSYHLS